MDATDCTVEIGTSAPNTLLDFQRTDASNLPIGQANDPFDIPVGGSTSLVISMGSSADVSSREVGLILDCANTPPAPLSGANLFTYTSTSDPSADVIAIIGSQTPGVVVLPGAGWMQSNISQIQ